jgi:hypothetical protein
MHEREAALEILMETEEGGGIDRATRGIGHRGEADGTGQALRRRGGVDRDPGAYLRGRRGRRGDPERPDDEHHDQRDQGQTESRQELLHRVPRYGWEANILSCAHPARG